MSTRAKAKVTVPKNSPAFRGEVEKTLGSQFAHVDFTILEGDADSRLRLNETEGGGPALFEAILVVLKRIDRKYK